MYALDLFETPGTPEMPEQDPRPHGEYVPVNPEKPGARNRALGNANLAILMKSINNVDMNNRPAPLPAKLSFLDGRSYTIDPKYYPALIGYYRSLSDVERVNLIYRTFVSYNKTIKMLNTLSQGTLFEKEEKKSSKYKDVAVQRAMRQAKADFPTAASDAEAFAKSMMIQQDQDKKNIDRLKSATGRTQELVAKNDELDQSQARSIDAIQQEINKVEKDNDSLTKMVQQMNRANAELQDKLSRMRGRTPAEPVSVTATEPAPQLGVSVATDKPAPAEPAADVSPIDIGARQKLNDLSKSVTGALLQLKDKEQAQGLAPAEQERLEKLEKRLAQIEKAQSVFKGFKSKQAKKEKQAGDAAISAIAKAMGGDTTGADVKAVEPTNIKPAPTIEPLPTPDEKKSNVLKFVPRDLTGAPITGDQDSEEQPELKFKEDLTHGLEEELPSKATLKLQQWKNRQAQQQAQQAPVAEPTVAPAEPQPVPARLSDLQARQQKFKTLTKIKKKIEAAQKKATAGGRLLPRGLAADLEDYYTVADVDQYYDEILAKYTKQLAALEQYANMKKILNKKVTHEMRAHDLEEDESSKAYDDGGREGYYGRPNRNPHKPGTQEHDDYNAGYEHFKGDKNWDAPKRRLPEDTMGEFKAAALAKIKKALNNPKLDPSTRKDYETRLKKIQDLEEAKWKKETPWTKSTGKDPRGEVTHMSDVARKETERREREASPMGQLFKDFEKVFGKKPPIKEGDLVKVDFRHGAGSEDLVAFKNTRGDYFDKIDRAAKAGDVESVKRLRVELKDLEDAARRRGLIK